LLLEAVKVDPEFASAHILLAYVVNEQEGRLGEVIAHAERAVARADRVTEVERLFITATHQKFLGRATQDREEWARLYNSAAASYEALLRLQPDHYWALDRLALTYSNLGRAPDAARASLVLASMRPNSGRWYAWAAYEMLRAGDLPEAVRLAAEARTRMNPGEYEIDPAMGGLVVMDAQIAWMRGDVTEALRVTDAVWASRELLRSGARRTEFGMQVAHMYLALGRLSQAEEAAGWIPHGPLRFQALATTIAGAADPDRIHTFLRGGRPAELQRVPGLLIETGRLDEARAVIARQAVKSEIALGLLAAAEGRHAEAIPMLERATARLGPAWSLGWLKAARRLAEVYDSKGHLTRAVQTLERASQLPLGEVTSLWSAGSQWLLMRAQLADLYRKTGRASEAQRIDSELQQLLLVADPDHPLTRRN
jgi:tetratricopeptide (TPR) repeat protein